MNGVTRAPLIFGSGYLCGRYFFCNFEYGERGTCQKCKEDIAECLSSEVESGIVSELGKEDCLMCHLDCHNTYSPKKRRLEERKSRV
mmetsp:Transcript_54629/g.65863  ORF Transcript_54629/g.65863 Transcript_54629/m.65863 type:complete len:87 (-) Transcript_54629:438-698(-)